MIGEVQATDADHNVITYILSGPGSNNFQVSSTGVIIMSDYIYITEGTQFTLTATASDGLFSAATTVRVNVTGPLSIPEIVTVVVCGLILLMVVLVVVLLASILCCRQ